MYYGDTTALTTNPNRALRGHTRAATVSDFSKDRRPPLSMGLSSRHVKSLSISGYNISTIELGRQELFIQTPFTAVFGLHAKERELERAFAHFAAERNARQHPEWDETEKKQHHRRESKMILQDLEQVDAPEKVLTGPFVLAILVATAAQFSVGYNTGVMNAPEAVVFPGHSTSIWSLAVAAFAVGGPLGAVLGGRLADSNGRRGALLIDSWTFLLGGMLQTLAPNMTMIVVSRFIIGFASGFSSVLVPIYLGEVRALERT